MAVQPTKAGLPWRMCMVPPPLGPPAQEDSLTCSHRAGGPGAAAPPATGSASGQRRAALSRDRHR
eukprot:6876130-Prymnesium_polylepis.1